MPGKSMFIADALYQAAVEGKQDADAEISADFIVHINAMYDGVNATPKKLSQIKIWTGRGQYFIVCG